MTPVRLSAASTPKWACAWDSDRGVHLWRNKADPDRTIAMHSHAAWMPGDDFVKPRPNTPTRQSWTVRDGVHAAPEGDHFYSAGEYTTYQVAGPPDNPGHTAGPGIKLHPTLTTNPIYADAIGERTRVAAFHRGTGDILTRRTLGGWFEYRVDRGHDPIQSLPHFLGVPIGDPYLWSWTADDEFHLCRVFMDDLGLWRQTGDPAARWRMLMLAEDVRMSYSQLEVAQTSAQWVPRSLPRMHRDARKGGNGHPVRGSAWCLRIAAVALEVGSHNRAEWEAWIGSYVRWLETVQSDEGWFYRGQSGSGMDNDEPRDLYEFDPTWTWTTTWQLPFLARALWEAAVQFPSIKRRVTKMLAKLHAFHSGGPFVADQYGTSLKGLPVYWRIGAGAFSSFRGTDFSRPMYDADMYAVFVRAGIIPKLPKRYAYRGENGITDDSLRVAEEYGVA